MPSSVPLPPVAADHADAALLALCVELRVLQVGWQTLWDATSDDPKADTAADRLFDDYCDTGWPGYCADPATDPVARLLTLPATTIAGFQAKAAALRALSDASGYSDASRGDECAMMAAFLREVAGSLFMPLGEDAPPRAAGATEITVDPPG